MTAREIAEKKRAELPAAAARPQAKRRGVSFPKAGMKLREFRRGLGLTMAECDTITNTCSMSFIERGALPRLDTAIKLARFYETTVEEIWGPEVPR